MKRVGKSALLWCNGGQHPWPRGGRQPHSRPTTMNVPTCAMPVLTMFRPAFSTPTSHRFLVLVLAAILTTGRRTVTTLLRTVRAQAPGQISASHRVLSRRRWSARALARPLMTFLLDCVVPPGPVRLAGDGTVTEHPGPKVFGKGRHRDGVRSSHSSTACRWGPNWGVVAGLVKRPCATRPWALPVLVALVPPPGVGPGAWHAAQDASAHGPAAAGTPEAWVPGASRHPRGRFWRWHQRDGALVSATPPAPDRGQYV